MAGMLDTSRTIAPRGFNRGLVPPAALCLHPAIGMAYGFSVVWLPLEAISRKCLSRIAPGGEGMATGTGCVERRAKAWMID